MRYYVLLILVMAIFGCSSGGSRNSGVDASETADLSSLPGLISKTTIYFHQDSLTVAPEYERPIREKAALLKEHASIHVEVQGHCNQTGTTEFSLALADQRAVAVAALLTSCGAPASQVHVITFGEEIPKNQVIETNVVKNDRVQLMFYQAPAEKVS